MPHSQRSWVVAGPAAVPAYCWPRQRPPTHHSSSCCRQPAALRSHLTPARNRGADTHSNRCRRVAACGLWCMHHGTKTPLPHNCHRSSRQHTHNMPAHQPASPVLSPPEPLRSDIPTTLLLNLMAPRGSCSANTLSRRGRDTPRVSLTPPAARAAWPQSLRLNCFSSLPLLLTNSMLHKTQDRTKFGV